MVVDPQHCELPLASPGGLGAHVRAGVGGSARGGGVVPPCARPDETQGFLSSGLCRFGTDWLA
jgi:hypothetical protein